MITLQITEADFKALAKGNATVDIRNIKDAIGIRKGEEITYVSNKKGKRLKFQVGKTLIVGKLKDITEKTCSNFGLIKDRVLADNLALAEEPVILFTLI